MTVEQLRQRAEIAVERMRFLGEAYTESVAVEGRTLLALLDIAEAAQRACIECALYRVSGKRCRDAVCPRCDLRAALSRLDREDGQ